MQSEYAKTNTTVKPLVEIMSYLQMLSCEAVDWKLFAETVTLFVENEEISSQLFYSFMNKVFELSFMKQMSVIAAINSKNLRDTLAHDMNHQVYDESWYQRVFPQYNHAKYIKSQNDIAKFQNITPYIQQKPQASAYQEFLKRANPTEVTKLQPPIKLNPPTPQKKVNMGLISRQWVKQNKPLLKEKYKKDFGNGNTYCMKYHLPDLVCADAKKPFCRSGKFIRVHNCPCGAKHRMTSCNKIFK